MSGGPDHFDKLVDDAVQRNKAKRGAHARALWRNAETPELRAHLRLVYPDLFKDAPSFDGLRTPRREQPARTNIRYPEGFHSWPLEQRSLWWAEATRLYTHLRKSAAHER